MDGPDGPMSTKILWRCETSNFVPVFIWRLLYVSSVLKPYSKWKPKNRKPKNQRYSGLYNPSYNTATSPSCMLLTQRSFPICPAAAWYFYRDATYTSSNDYWNLLEECDTCTSGSRFRMKVGRTHVQMLNQLKITKMTGPHIALCMFMP